jgi:hypothetical protein
MHVMKVKGGKPCKEMSFSAGSVFFAVKALFSIPVLKRGAIDDHYPNWESPYFLPLLNHFLSAAAYCVKFQADSKYKKPIDSRGKNARG